MITTLYSRRENVLNGKFPYIAKSLDGLPNGTVIDGELVAHSSDGRPNFNLLQNFRSAESHIIYYAFDVLVHKGHDLTQIPSQNEETFCAPSFNPRSTSIFRPSQKKPQRRCLPSFASIA